ncbi:MAG: hypothetical protein NC300_11330 [Bacteroidales bacterium]|nr:hypothetical protein [Clostridium sp.]MCM1204723.1 hypothetical protein [Bacteroidales bacterium]
MHIENRHYLRNGMIEVEQVQSSMAGNHNRRGSRSRPSEEAVRKTNERRIAKTLRRLIIANFGAGDMYLTLTYKAGEKKTLEEIDKDMDGFIRRLKYRYRKRKKPLKWIAAAGVNAPHVHIIINTIDGINYIKDLEGIWGHGHCNIKPLYEEGRYKALAEYMAKHKSENERKLKRKLTNRKAYRNSRNLKRPRMKRKRITEKTLRRKPAVPAGYRVEELEEGISRETGYLYRHFFLIAVKRRE